MAKKPSYSDLESRIKELETAANSPKHKIFERLFNLSLDILCVADITEGRFLAINESFEKTISYTNKELMEYPFLHFVHPEDYTATVSAIEQLADGEPITHFENRYRCKDGSYKILDWTSMPVPNDGLTYAIARDVTKSKENEEELRRYRNDLEEIVQERTTALEKERQKAEAANHTKSTFLAQTV